MATTSHKAYRKKESHGGALLKAPPGFKKTFHGFFFVSYLLLMHFMTKILQKNER